MSLARAFFEQRISASWLRVSFFVIDAKGLGGRALHGGFGLGVRALVELYGEFGRARWRPQFVCVEKRLWGFDCLMRRPRLQALASVYFFAGAMFGDCVKAWWLCGRGGLSGGVWLHEWLPPCGTIRGFGAAASFFPIVT